MKINKIRILSLIACFSMSVAMIGCQESPEESVVVNKDMDNLIEEATKEDDEGFDVEEDAGKYNTYKTEITNEALGVHVSVDAKVDIPQTDKLSMYRVEQKPISQEMIDAIRKELIGEETMYNGEKLEEPLKSEIEGQIADYREEIANMKWDGSNGAFISKEDADSRKRDVQKMINELEEEYKAAPEEFVWDKEADIYDEKIRKVADLYNADKDFWLWDWMYECNPKGDVYYGVTDGSNGSYSMLYAHTNPYYSNVIRYRKCAYGLMKDISQWSELDKNDRCKGREIKTEEMKGIIFDDTREKIILDEKTTMSKEEAIKLADEFLNNVGLGEFKCYEGDIYTECETVEEFCDIDATIFRTCYILTYMRTVNGVFVNPSDGSFGCMCCGLLQK